MVPPFQKAPSSPLRFSPPLLPGELDVEVEGISLSNPPPDQTVPIQIYFSSVQIGTHFAVHVDAMDVPEGQYEISIVWNYAIVGGGSTGPFIPTSQELLKNGTLTVTKDANDNFSVNLEWHNLDDGLVI